MREDADGGFLAELVLTDGRRVQIGTEPLVIGRLPECGVVLADPNVSRRHAELRRAGDGVVRHRPRLDQRDTGERRARSASSTLASGDEITVGSTTTHLRDDVKALHGSGVARSPHRT